MDAATRSIFARYDEVDGDFSQEIAVYQAAIQAQLQILRDLGTGEIAAMTGWPNCWADDNRNQANP